MATVLVKLKYIRSFFSDFSWLDEDDDDDDWDDDWDDDPASGRCWGEPSALCHQPI